MFEAFSALPNTFALGYFDAFALSKQPAMGEFTCLQKVCQMMKNQGVIVTYCAQGKRKRPLQELGVHVETLAGLPGKKAMTRAWQGGCIGGIGDWQLCWLLYAIGSWL